MAASVWHAFDLVGTASASDRALLREQFRTLAAQIPFMYALMAVDACFLSFAMYRDVPHMESLGVPALLCFAALVRTIVWLRRSREERSPETIRRYLKFTLATSAVLSLGFGGWGMLLFENADLAERTCIALYIFIGATSCAYCLQCLPGSARFVLLCGAAPMTLRLLLSAEWLLIGLGVDLVVVMALILRMLSTNYGGFLEVISSRSEILAERERARDAEQRAHDLAYHDPLTGLPNRRALSDLLDGSMAAPGEAPGFGLLIVDLDRFKSINDVHGHLAGDQLLREVAARLLALTGDVARAFRLGGDEFAIVVETGPEDGDAPRRIARRIVQGMSEPFAISGFVHHIGASIGISLFPADAVDRETLMRRADIALYRAKEGGRCQHRCFEPLMDAEIKRRSELESQLRETILADGFRPYYQPLVELASGRIVGFEMLARWPRPDGFEIGPDQFIPVAEESGLINELMLQLLERGCRDALEWDPALSIEINISPVQLKDPWLSEKILGTLIRLNFPPHRLGIEITENALIVDADNARRTIESLKNQGMKVALDDFGTGYSSLQHLRMLPFDKIKIDRSFVLALDRDADALKIVRAITSLASSLDLPVVAEGIECEAAVQQLGALGCAFGQGFHLGRPLSADQVRGLLNGNVAAGAA
ncbi:bifunctional diguanylate cyclase/phosphodiesterase [Sphingosinicella sp. BN140058]|uniref:putative bifunctional diguanylate cyclase/phosphodiesterase n=1 Tax=Sphingosinicella sp. BN140058 TaxID=1892855 RepID=UPI0010129332|nr:EAL domain-containing protein [Sphingosinicella sp. BN140058]QAY79890.1 EAL domain-containing protein [Sphingosinicella sp. BN140058]